MRAVLYCLLSLLALQCSAPHAWAQTWAIQVFAFAGEVQAAAVATQLRAVGFDAYSSVSVESSLVQVRIGCFSDQSDADGLAQDVRQRVALDALVVPFKTGDAATVCVTRQLGFIPPPSWGVERETATSVTFWLGADGRTITFGGDTWILEQGDGSLDPLEPFAEGPLDAPLEPRTPAGLSAQFRATRSRGLPLVRADLEGGSLLITSGQLLWASAQAAVVQGGADVFALRLYRP